MRNWLCISRTPLGSELRHIIIVIIKNSYIKKNKKKEFNTRSIGNNLLHKIKKTHKNE